MGRYVAFAKARRISVRKRHIESWPSRVVPLYKNVVVRSQHSIYRLIVHREIPSRSILRPAAA